MREDWHVDGNVFFRDFVMPFRTILIGYATAFDLLPEEDSNATNVTDAKLASSDSTIVLGPSHRRASRRFKSLESLEARIVLDARLLISEIVADNETGLVDSEGDRTDWIEIYNAGDESENLQGWYLTDDADTKTKWSFPAMVINPSEYLIVHASGKNRVDATGELHTNFQLRAKRRILGTCAT